MILMDFGWSQPNFYHLELASHLEMIIAWEATICVLVKLGLGYVIVLHGVRDTRRRCQLSEERRPYISGDCFYGTWGGVRHTRRRCGLSEERHHMCSTKGGIRHTPCRCEIVEELCLVVLRRWKQCIVRSTSGFIVWSWDIRIGGQLQD